jgi:hypothetical protein
MSCTASLPQPQEAAVAAAAAQDTCAVAATAAHDQQSEAAATTADSNIKGTGRSSSLHDPHSSSSSSSSGVVSVRLTQLPLQQLVHLELEECCVDDAAMSGVLIAATGLRTLELAGGGCARDLLLLLSMTATLQAVLAGAWLHIISAHAYVLHFLLRAPHLSSLTLSSSSHSTLRCCICLLVAAGLEGLSNAGLSELTQLRRLTRLISTQPFIPAMLHLLASCRRSGGPDQCRLVPAAAATPPHFLCQQSMPPNKVLLACLSPQVWRA